MRKRITLLVVALMMALSMAFGAAGTAFADPNCADPKHADHPNCERFGPGNSENTAAFGKNPNTGANFEPPGRS
jgi:hypothetical protein